MAVSSKEIETLWKRYSDEGSKKGVSVAEFFESNGVPYHTFEKWYRRKFHQPDIVECTVVGGPSSEMRQQPSGQILVCLGARQERKRIPLLHPQGNPDTQWTQAEGRRAA